MSETMAMDYLRRICDQTGADRERSISDASKWLRDLAYEGNSLPIPGRPSPLGREAFLRLAELGKQPYLSHRKISALLAKEGIHISRELVGYHLRGSRTMARMLAGGAK